MIEIFYIIAQILFILAIAYFPIILFENNVYFNSLKFDLLDKLSINLIFFMNLLFLTSILNINTYNILYIYFFTWMNSESYPVVASSVSQTHCMIMAVR